MTRVQPPFWLIWMILYAALAMTVASASAVVLVHPNQQPVGGQWQRWADRSFARTWQGKVIFHTHGAQDCAQEAVGCMDFVGSFVDAQPIIWVSPCVGDLCDADVRGIELHELGHVFDYRVLTDAERSAFERIWHLRPQGAIDSDWWQPRGDYGAPSEWFAEAYRLCGEYRSLWAARQDWPSYGFPGAGTARDRVRLSASCHLIRWA